MQKSKVKLGVVGLGFVGKAVSNGLKTKYDIETYDINCASTCDSIVSLAKAVQIVFICVPTPMNRDGSCSTEIVETVVEQLNEAKQNNILVVKSTVPPGTTERLSEKYKNVDIIFSPEFLTEANYINDFISSNRVIFGGDLEKTSILVDIFLNLYPDKKYIQTDPTTAEMVKYVANTFLSTKVSFANEIYDICLNIGIDYEEVVNFATLDSRLGNSHWRVPGPDGKRGFGGSCFPKDTNGLISFAESVGIEPQVLKAVWKKNLQVRPERDWEELVGRAITKEIKNE